MYVTVKLAMNPMKNVSSMWRSPGWERPNITVPFELAMSDQLLNTHIKRSEFPIQLASRVYKRIEKRAKILEFYSLTGILASQLVLVSDILSTKEGMELIKGVRAHQDDGQQSWRSPSGWRRHCQITRESRMGL